MSKAHNGPAADLYVFRMEAWQYKGPCQESEVHLVPEWVLDNPFPCKPFTACLLSQLVGDWLTTDPPHWLLPGSWFVRNIDGRVFLFTDAEFRRRFRRVSG